MVKSAFQALLAPPSLRLAVEPIPKSQPSKSDDDDDFTPQTRSSKSAVQSGVTKSSVQQSAVQQQSSVQQSAVQQSAVQPVGFCSRCTRQFAGKYFCLFLYIRNHSFGSGFNQVSGSGSVFGIKIRIGKFLRSSSFVSTYFERS
jgi:hypothetical protein